MKTTQELVQELALRSSTPTGPVKTSSGSSHLVNETKTELMNRFFESQNGNGNQHSDVLSPPLSDGPPSPTLAKSGQNLAKNASSTNDSNVNKVQSVEDILAQLPPIDTAAILAEINSEIMQNPEENSSNHDGENDNNSDVINNDDSDVEMATEESDQEEIEGLIPIPVTKKLKKVRQSKNAKVRENSNSKKKLSKGVEAALVDELHAGQHESVNGNFNHDGAFKEWHEVVTKETVNGDLLYILPYSVID